METRLNHHITVELKVIKITHPDDIRLCPACNVSLTIDALTYTFRAFPKPPQFPIRYNETFLMEGLLNFEDDEFDSIEEGLANEAIRIIMWQNKVQIAHFVGTIRDLTEAKTGDKDIKELEMQTTSSFTGDKSPTILFKIVTKIDKIDVKEKKEKADKRKIDEPDKKLEGETDLADDNRKIISKPIKPLLRHSPCLKVHRANESTSFCNENIEDSKEPVCLYHIELPYHSIYPRHGQHRHHHPLPTCFFTGNWCGGFAQTQDSLWWLSNSNSKFVPGQSMIANLTRNEPKKACCGVEECKMNDTGKMELHDSDTCSICQRYKTHFKIFH